MLREDEFLSSTPSRSGWKWFWAVLVFGGVYGLFALWPISCLHPSVWGDVAIAAGLRPPDNPFPGLYRSLVAMFFAYLPRDTVFAVLMQLGRVFVALSAVCIYLVFRETLPAVLRMRVHLSRMGMYIGNVVAILAAMMFACAEPIWRAGQTFSPVSLFLLMATWSGCLFFRFIRRGSINALYGCFMLLGFISAETTLGFVMLVLALFSILLAVKWANDPEVPLVNPLVDDLMRAVVFKRLTYAWLACFVAGVTLNVFQFVWNDGLAATGHVGILGLLFEYFRGAYESTISAATGPGWLFALLLAFAPMVFVLNLLPKAWDDDRFLPWSVAMGSGVAGVVSLSQLAGAPVLWFWTWLGTSREMVPCDILLAFILVFDVATVAFVLVIFGVDACCRNYRRIAKQQYPESMLEEGPAQMAESLGKARVWRQRAFVALVVAVPLLVVPGRVQSVSRDMLDCMRAYVDEVLAETKECDTMFTDGSFDALVELEAFRLGRKLECLSMMAPNTSWERKVRYRSALDDEDRKNLENDAATALREWVASRPERLGKVAVQIGFEMWKRVKKPLPPCSGLVALPGGVDAKERERALAACDDLGDRVEELAKRGRGAAKDVAKEVIKDGQKPADVESVTDAEVRRKFPFVLWRLARLAQMRSQIDDLAGNRGQAVIEAAKADMLDEVNASARKLKRDMNWIKMQNGGQLTPREGLVIGLSRADFAFAGRFAAPVLAADPDDPRANFAMGMMYFQQEQYTRAEQHLLRCLVKRPDEPAVLNNLAIVCHRLGKFDEAEKHVRKALAAHPEIQELKKTLDNVLKAKSKSAAEKPATTTK